MNAPLVMPRSDAEQAFAQAFAARANAGQTSAARATAFEQFSKQGLPSRRVESWHYTDLRVAMRKALPIAGKPDAAARAAVEARLASLRTMEAVRCVVLDGAFDAGLSSRDLPIGLSIRSSRDVAERADDLGADDAVVALNLALAVGGISIEVAPGARVEKPIELIFIASGAQPQAIFSRSAIRIGDGAQARFIERRMSLGSAATQRNEALHIALGKDARLDHAAVYDAAPADTIDVASFMLDLGQGAQARSTALLHGAGLRRRQVFVRMNGTGASCELSGVALLASKEHADTTIVMDHASPHCVSRETFHHIVDDDATGVFQGRITVAPHAQKTDGRMRSRAILLSDDASMNNKPELEIFADDVTCGHGATCGSLDENQLFYAQSRGLPRPVAEALILEGFAGEILDGVADEVLREAMMEDVRAWLARRGM